MPCNDTIFEVSEVSQGYVMAECCSGQVGSVLTSVRVIGSNNDLSHHDVFLVPDTLIRAPPPNPLGSINRSTGSGPEAS